jgi:hypothetical protein
MAIKYQYGQLVSPVTAKTADYTVVTEDFGKTFTNRGDAGAIVFTLPSPVGRNGNWVRFYCCVDEDMSVTTAAGEQLVMSNNATGDTYTLGTTAEQIGSSVVALSDGTSWLIIPSIAAEAVTATFTDA